MLHLRGANGFAHTACFSSMTATLQLILANIYLDSRLALHGLQYCRDASIAKQIHERGGKFRGTHLQKLLPIAPQSDQVVLATPLSANRRVYHQRLSYPAIFEAFCTLSKLNHGCPSFIPDVRMVYSIGRGMGSIRNEMALCPHNRRSTPFQKPSFLSRVATPPEINMLIRTKTPGKTFAVLPGFCHCQA